MKKNRNNKNTPSSNWSFLSIFFILVMFGSIISCETEDDTPPPSAYVAPEKEPEPVEGDCTFQTIVPDLSEGVDFECGGPEVTFFGEKDGSFTLEYIENPDASGINPSETVVEYTQTPDVEPWAGFFFDLTGKVNFSELQTIKIKVYSPAADQIVLLKFEDTADDTNNKEVQATTTVANEWEELSFAFSPSDTDKYDRMVLFFDFNGPKDTETIHYFDEITMAEGGATEEPEVSLTEPTHAPTIPNVDPNEVISLFSEAYTNVAIDTWRTDWSDATLEDVNIADNDIKKYSNLNFVGIETVSSQIDATSMTHFHVDIWTANATEFKVKLVDFGADGAFDGGDDTEHEVVVENPTQEEWVSLDLPLSGFTGLTSRANLAQYIFVGAPSKENTVFIDNVFFYNSAGISDQPTAAAPLPTVSESNVISLFSDAYTNVPVDTWRTEWSIATLEDIQIEGNNTKKYSDLNFVGVETVGTQIDASTMTHFHTDIWTGDATEVRIKLVDFGPDGAFDGGDDTEHEITVANPEQATWISLDIPLSDFTGLTTKQHISQLIYAGQPVGSTTIFIDNVYFHN